MRVPCFLVLAMFALAAAGQVVPAATGSVTTLAPVRVSGEQPGPGLWKVSSPAGHVLWVLGTLDPLPRGMQWESREVRERLAQSKELLREPGLKLDAHLGFFGSLALLPRLIGIRNNPDGARLADVVPPATYARWLVLKARYIGRSGKVEKWRPLFAGFRLYEAAIERIGLDRKGVVPLLVGAARQAGIPSTSTAYRVTVEDPKALVKDFKRERLDDVACFEAMLDRVDVDLARMSERASAWASGDLDTLRRLSGTSADVPCADAVSEAGFARRLGLGDLEGKVREAWLAQARRALADDASSFALLPIDQALRPDGYLAALVAEGYTVQPPDGDGPTDEAGPAGTASAGR
ncbi:TraB/GumN family protein [Fulvimonas yonginensis]|uniref:TraB/GumN family protein n=1 Tax=Fulvimonas yonginensis TaxID=1495200 RepID=A0ABU8J879_9GAMM